MKILVIGAGSIGKRHLTNAVKLANEAALFDLDYDFAKSYAKEAGASCFETLDDALAWKPDGVIVATPHKTHIGLARKAIDAGADVLIEKPISNALEGVEDFLSYAEGQGRKVYVVCNMRFHQAVNCLKENLSRVGKVLYARAQYGNYLPNMRPDADYKKLYCAHKDQGGGVVLDAIHEIDYLSWFFGKVVSVSCEADKLSNLDIDVEDYASLCLKHESGVRTEIHLDYLQQCKRRGCEIVGTKGTLIWESEGKNPELCRVRLFNAEAGSWEMLYEDNDLDMTVMYHELMKRYISVLGGSENGQDLLEGKGAFETLGVALQALAGE